MTPETAAPSSPAACLPVATARGSKPRNGAWPAALGMGATVLHYAGHHGGQILGCLVPILQLRALDVGAALLLLAGSIYVSRRPHGA